MQSVEARLRRNENPADDVLNHATTGAAPMRLQYTQWQSVE
jgi:hypothetical protein